MNTLGDEIQVKRLENGISARKLAAGLNIPVAAVMSWERDQSIPNPVQLTVMKQLLGGEFHCNPTVQ